ncbi:hypothetical protein QA601_05770 [Chitinispirillales bacterium ANBcel5]|nr:hypothetical protein [Chitinispirillales bacterium ANBcel5]
MNPSAESAGYSQSHIYRSSYSVLYTLEGFADVRSVNYDLTSRY